MRRYKRVQASKRCVQRNQEIKNRVSRKVERMKQKQEIRDGWTCWTFRGGYDASRFEAMSHAASLISDPSLVSTFPLFIPLHDGGFCVAGLEV